MIDQNNGHRIMRKWLPIASEVTWMCSKCRWKMNDFAKLKLNIKREGSLHGDRPTINVWQSLLPFVPDQRFRRYEIKGFLHKSPFLKLKIEETFITILPESHVLSTF
jgi:hypothetical protein